jgi:transposase-like protein
VAHAFEDHTTPHRFSAEAKAAAVLRVLKGEPARAVAGELDISEERLASWESRFMRGGRQALEHRKRSLASRWRKARGSMALWLGLVVMLAALVWFLARFFAIRPE